MNFLKDNIITDLFKNNIEIKPLSIFKVILAYISQQIIMIPIMVIFVIIIFSVSDGNFIIEDIFINFALLISTFIVVKLFKKPKWKTISDESGKMSLEKIDYNRQKPLKLTKKLIISAVLLALGYILITSATLHHFLEDIAIPADIESYFNQIFEQNIIFIIFTMTICPAFLEEFMMRGFLLNGLLNKYKPSLAIVLSAVIFGLFHGNVPQFINATIAGVITGVLYYKTRSLWLCIIEHAANNFLAFFLIMPTTLIPKIIVSLIYLVVGFFIIRYAMRNLGLIDGFKEVFPKKKKINNI